MSSFEPRAVIMIAFAAPLLVAAAWDIAFYRIPNMISLVVAALFVVCALVWGVEVKWLSHIGAALAVLAVGFGVFALGLLGGGDVKLLTAVALWIGWGNDLLAYVLLVAVIGGVLALTLVGLRGAIHLWAGAWQPSLPRVMQTGAPVPYGLAIATVALYMAPQASQFVFMR